jgi:hypothetical protein
LRINLIFFFAYNRKKIPPQSIAQSPTQETHTPRISATSKTSLATHQKEQFPD